MHFRLIFGDLIIQFQKIVDHFSLNQYFNGYGRHLLQFLLLYVTYVTSYKIESFFENKLIVSLLFIPESVRGHFLRNVTNPSKPVCSFCGRIYSSSSNLKKHLHNVHIKTPLESWMKCDYCGKLCKTKHYLMNHQLQKHGIRRNRQKILYTT